MIDDSLLEKVEKGTYLTSDAVDIAIPPANTACDLLKNQGKSLPDFVKAMRWTEEEAIEFFMGKRKLATMDFTNLANFFGPSEKFWKVLEENYREDLDRIKKRGLEK